MKIVIYVTCGAECIATHAIEAEDSSDTLRKVATTTNYLRSILAPDYEYRRRAGEEARRAPRRTPSKR